MNKKQLIEQMTPLYNIYKQNKDHMFANEAIEIMWDIGDLLKKYIDEYKVRPHSLYRDIYGKSEGSKNITQKSYITREFQSRCYRIRNIFFEKRQIKTQFPNLVAFNLFREVMPFFDNSKYRLEGKEKENLLKLLNSNLKRNVILKKIKLLQKEKINITNPRTQRLEDVSSAKEDFIRIYNEVFRCLSFNDYDYVLHILKERKIEKEFIKILARNTAALTDEGIQFIGYDLPKKMDPIWRNYSKTLQSLIEQKDAKVRRRFRRIIPPQRIIRLVDMFYALTDIKNYDNFKDR